MCACRIKDFLRSARVLRRYIVESQMLNIWPVFAKEDSNHVLDREFGICRGNPEEIATTNITLG